MMIRFEKLSNSVLAPALASMSPGRLTDSREGRVSASNAPPAPNQSPRNVSPTFQPASASFKRSYVAQALIDVGAVLFGLVFIGLWLASVGFSVVVLLLLLGS